MTITYSIITRGIAGNRRLNTGQVTSSSGEGTYWVDPQLRTVDYFDINTIPGGLSGDVVITYPTSFPAVMASGYVTVVLLSGATAIWTALGKV
jgi:hypothetical protein